MILSRLKVCEDGHRREAHTPGRRHRAAGGDKRVDLRVNTVPTVHGEKMVSCEFSTRTPFR